MVRERESRRAEAHDEHAAPRGRFGVGAAYIERIPARKERIDLEAPRQLEHVLQRSRLGLRDVYRFLLLVDAGFHAVVADAMAGGGHHRVVERDDAERRQRLAARLHHVELGDLLFQWATGERHAEHRISEALRGRLLLEALRARIFALLMAPDAVVRL